MLRASDLSARHAGRRQNPLQGFGPVGCVYPAQDHRMPGSLDELYRSAVGKTFAYTGPDDNESELIGELAVPAHAPAMPGSGPRRDAPETRAAYWMLTVLLPANGDVPDGPTTVAVTVCGPKLRALVDIWKLHPDRADFGQERLRVGSLSGEGWFDPGQEDYPWRAVALWHAHAGNGVADVPREDRRGGHHAQRPVPCLAADRFAHPRRRPISTVWTRSAASEAPEREDRSQYNRRCGAARSSCCSLHG
jgi:hypothetical protein